MNYYEHHIGDYQKKTAHLSILEHGVYMLMLQAYYATEKPLPVDVSLYRIVRATTKVEKRAVDFIIQEFWIKKDGGLVNARAIKQIEAYQAYIEGQRTKGKASGAARQRNNGSTAVQPRLNGGSHSVATEREPPTSHSHSHSHSHTQNKKRKEGEGEHRATRSAPARLPLDFDLTEDRIEVAEAHEVEPYLTFEKFVDHFTAAAGAKGLRADWDAAWRIWCRDEASGHYPGQAKPKTNGNGHATDPAVLIWTELIATNGKRRDARIQAAIDAVGGWTRIDQRTERESPKIQREFCEAYRAAR